MTRRRWIPGRRLDPVAYTLARQASAVLAEMDELGAQLATVEEALAAELGREHTGPGPLRRKHSRARAAVHRLATELLKHSGYDVDEPGGRDVA